MSELHTMIKLLWWIKGVKNGHDEFVNVVCGIHMYT